jgi:hypothetical protein
MVEEVEDAQHMFFRTLRNHAELEAGFRACDLQVELLSCFDIRLTLRPHLLSVHFKQNPALTFFGNSGLHYLIWLQIVLHGVSTLL